ncbi:Acg family FMN-binding oxidoreductase [Actinocorallia aurantiaca]|uniref:Nitroreductase family protein n=1 Tax=Actinocorallia aurantiaca TaxID=46204 RepID=A0ABN3UEQ5_9ACTN
MTVGTDMEGVMRAAIEAAVWAPSVNNTQPWWFGTSAYGQDGARVSLHSDSERRLDIADPDGREMLVSCGAALFTLRLAVQARGYEPRVRVLPEPDRPGLLADLVIDPAAEAEPGVGPEIERLYRQVKVRRSHRGAFEQRVVPTAVLTALREEAHREGAELFLVSDPRERRALAAFTEVAEQLQRLDPEYQAEAARWAPPPGRHRSEGMVERSYPAEEAFTSPHFATRDFAQGRPWGAREDRPPDPGITGVVAIITTRGDDRADWLAAGQGMQRMLLHASAEGLSAALHTQPLEIPELRALIRVRLCRGGHPQVLLRLGEAASALGTVRRKPDELTDEEV